MLVSGSRVTELDCYKTDRDLSRSRREGVLAIWVEGSRLTCSSRAAVVRQRGESLREFKSMMI